MTRVLGFLDTSVGKKLVMAVSGAFLLLFAIGHMVGNLQLYMGPKYLNAYAAFLREFGHGAGIWVARAGIILAALAHLWGAVTTTLASWRARPQGYRVWRSGGDASTLSSRTMRWTGGVIFVFIAYHLMHLTLGTAHPAFDEKNVFNNVVIGFQQLGASGFYILAMLALGLHMVHGGWSFLQTLGLSHARYNRLRYGVALLVALIVVGANLSFPISVLTGFVRRAPSEPAPAVAATSEAR
jgi:succinate dehydrogenase / fumarate reductase, cytochrome b subunit